MRKIFSLFAALTLSVGLWADDHYVPITIDANTLNGDVVMGKNQSVDDVWNAGHQGYGLDNTACFYSNNCSSVDPDLEYGLPATVDVPNEEGDTIPFNFTWTGDGQFDGHDAIHLVSNGEAVTVDLSGGNAFKGLYFLATAGNVMGGSSSITVTITYLDGTSKVSNFDILDWYYEEDSEKPTNAIQEFYRYNYDDYDVDYADNGPCLYCLSLNDALDPLKPIKSLTFTQTNDEMCTAIFAITGILNGCTPKAPENTAGIYKGNTTQITFDEVTEDLDDNSIFDVTYVYDVARDSNFIMILEGHTNQPLTCTVSGGTVTGTINADFKGLYIRVRAKNSCGASINSDVIVEDAATYYTVTIPYSEYYSTPNFASGARYFAGETVTLTAQLLVDGKDLGGWKNIHGTLMSTSNQVSFVITQDTTIQPNLIPEVRELTLATGVTGKMGTLSKDYPWIKTTTKSGLAYKSTNKGIDDSESCDTLVITPEAGKYYRLKFDYAVSSEESCDQMSVWVNEVVIADQISGKASDSYDSGVTLLTEPTTIVMFYGKDVSADEGEDRGYIYNIQVISYDTPPDIYTVTVLENEDGTVTGLAPEGKYISGDEVSLTATPNIRFELKEWQDGNGNQISTANPLTFTITQDTTLKPVYQVEQRSYEIANGVTAQMGKLNKNYPWTKTLTKPGLAYMSATGHDGQNSRDTLVITPETGVSYRLKFDYAVSSEEVYDTLSIWVNGEKIADQISGEDSDSYDSDEALLTGPTTIVMSYGKDGGDCTGEDRGYIYNIKVISNAPQVYTRDNLYDGKWGTICLGYAVPSLEDVTATFYKLNFYDGASSLYVTEVTELEAGKPYVFEAHAESFTVEYIPTDEPTPAETVNGLIGTLDGLTMEADAYALVNNMVVKAAAGTTVPANRAYIDLTQVSTEPLVTAGAPRRIGVASAPTGFELNNVQKKACKVLDKGQFVIIRDNKRFNAQGIEIQ